MTLDSSVDIRLLTGGDEKEFQILFIDYYPLLISFAKRYVEVQSVAEDIVQDVFVKVWEIRESLCEVENLSAYLYQMVRFKCFNYLRAEKVRREVAESFTEEMNGVEINEYIKDETFRLVMNALECLPARNRDIFSRTIQGYSAKEIAEELGIAVETVKKQKQIARRILKEKLGNLFTLFFIMV